MKRDTVIKLLLLLGGIILGLVASAFFCKNSNIDWSFRIVDIITIIATCIVSIIVIYITKSLDNNDVARQFIIDDLNRLCEIYRNIGEIIDNLHSQSSNPEIIKINDEAKKRIQLLFGDGDLLIDQINEEIKVVYNRLDDGCLRNISENYHKFITDGDLWSQSDYAVSLNFIKDNNDNLNKTIAQIKAKAIDIIKKS